MLPKLYTREEVRVYLGFGKTKMTEIIKDGEIKQLKNKKFTQQAVMDYLECDEEE